MLQKLRIQNAFVHKDLTIEFKDGLTAIVGKNGRGKSLIPEMIQYAYWGVKALRGEADDYKKLIVEHWFQLKGKDYYIKRSNSSTLLAQVVDGKLLTLATGVTPTNAAVIKLFGYGIDVFQVSNAANQGAVALLSQMKPTERKAMVDKTVGLQVIDVLEKFIADSLKTVTLQLDAKRDGHFPPTEPVKPLEYMPLTELDPVLTNKRQQLRTLEILQAQANVQVETPAPPKLTPQEHGLEKLREMHQAYVSDEAERASVARSLAGLPAPCAPVELTTTDVEFDALTIEQAAVRGRMAEKATLIRLIGSTRVTSEYTREQLVAEGAAVAMAKRWEEREALRAALHLNHCPNCNHEWHTPNPRLDDYADVPEERPVYTMSAAVVKTKLAELDQIEAAKPHYDALQKMLKDHPTDPERLVELTTLISNISQNRQAYALYQTAKGYDQMRAEYTERLAWSQLPGYAAAIQAAEANQRAEAAYQQALTAAQTAREKADIAAQAVATFPANLAEQVVALDRQVRDVIVYDQQATVYNTALTDYNARQAEIDGLEADAEGWRAARAAMADVRATVKSYLLPSLNKVATHLLAQMTGGELGGVEVDEDFDIKADGKKIFKLSGAGKDVANLALRLGLGTVLTNNTFSVLMLDEIDAGYDDERAAYTSRALQNLTKTFKQVIVISHKGSITSDHRIEL